MKTDKVISEVTSLLSDSGLGGTELRHIHVHFCDEDDMDIGHVPVATLLDDIVNCSITQWLEAGPDVPDDETRETLDISQASSLRLDVH